MASALLLFLRNPAYLLHARFFAEDGSNFYHDQLLFGWAGLMQTAGGYLNLVPRLLMQFNSIAPTRALPCLDAIESTLIAGLCCAVFACDRFRTILRSDALRVVLCLLAAAGLPEEEMAANLSFVQWFLVIAAVPLAWAPLECRRRICDVSLGVLGVLVATSAPLTIILVPLIVLRWIRVRKLDSFGAGLLAGTGFEWFFVATHWSARSGGIHSFAALGHIAFAFVGALGSQIIASCIVGSMNTYRLFLNHQRWESVLLLLLFIGIEAALYLKGTASYRATLRTVFWLLFSSLFLALARGMDALFTDVAFAQPFGGHRYFFLACWCFALLILLAIEEFGISWRGWQKAAVVTAIFLFGSLQNFHFRQNRNVPNWGRFVPEIQAWQSDYHAGRSHGALWIPVAPQGWNLGLPAVDHGRPQ